MAGGGCAMAWAGGQVLAVAGAVLIAALEPLLLRMRGVGDDCNRTDDGAVGWAILDDGILSGGSLRRGVGACGKVEAGHLTGACRECGLRSSVS